MKKTSYDPNQTPDPAVWREMDEVAGQRLVARYHRSPECEHPPGPDPRAHDLVHLIVERQAALGSEVPVAETIARLVGQGLSRHDAVHAVGSVLAGVIFDCSTEASPQGEDISERFFAELKTLTAESWLSSADAHAHEEGGGCCGCEENGEWGMECAECACGDECGCDDCECAEDCGCDGDCDCGADDECGCGCCGDDDLWDECVCDLVEAGEEDFCPACDEGILDDEPSEPDDSPAAGVGSSKVGRNEPCPCGSGRKYKQCCLGK